MRQFFKSNIHPSNVTLEILLEPFFSFAEQAKSVRTRPVCNIGKNDVILKQVRDDVIQLKTLKAEVEPLLKSYTGKLDDEIVDKESILLYERDMQSEEHIKFGEQKSIRVLTFRPFFACVNGHKKYQIGETSDNCTDAQSR